MVALLLAALAVQGDELLRNGDFEDESLLSWKAVAPAEFQKTVDFGSDAKQARRGRSAHIRNVSPANRQVNCFTQTLEAGTVRELRGKTVELSGWMRTYQATAADLWLQCLDDVDQELALFRPRPYGSVWGTTEWTRHVARGSVPLRARSVVVRCVVRGLGEAWFDDLSLREVKEAPPEPVAPLREEHRAFREAASRHVLGANREAVNAYSSWTPTEVKAALTGGLGLPPWRAGYKTFTFRARERRWSYELWIPDEARRGPRPLIVVSSSQKEAHRAWAALAKDCFVAGLPGDREIEDAPAGTGHAEVFDALLRDACARLPIDSDRVFITGYAAWLLAAVRPDRIAGGASMGDFSGAALTIASNLNGQGWFVSHGESDRDSPVGVARQMIEALRKYGVDHAYREHAETGHADVEIDRGNALDWLVARRRAPHPKRVALQLAAPSGAYWVDATQLPGGAVGAWKGGVGWQPVATVRGEIADNVVSVTCEHVRRLRVWLSPRLVDFDKPVKVVVNGKTAHDGALSPSFEAFLNRLQATGDGAACYWACVEVAIE